MPIARIGSFAIVRPRYEARQEEILGWLVDMHTAAARTAARDTGSFDRAGFAARMRRLVKHVGCGSDKIGIRGYSAAHDDSDFFDFTRSPFGAGTAARMARFEREAESAFERLYDGESEPPGDLVHVSCTGYVSPSAAQRLVARRGWGDDTRVTHAYHMGCYAAVPAVRIATEAIGRVQSARRRADIVHTELCSLHFDASVHTAEQLVVQSLFADGSIRYAVRGESSDARPGFLILSLHESLAENSADAMQWRLGDHGMEMTLSREIPERIGRTIRSFVGTLVARAGLDFGRERATMTFAVHPGGPKIIDAVRDALELSEAQIAASRRVLRRFGNMSSATLPHIWRELLDDVELPAGGLVASVAFGPGLTVAGTLFRKE